MKLGHWLQGWSPHNGMGTHQFLAILKSRSPNQMSMSGPCRGLGGENPWNSQVDGGALPLLIPGIASGSCQAKFRFLKRESRLVGIDVPNWNVCQGSDIKPGANPHLPTCGRVRHLALLPPIPQHALWKVEAGAL